MLGPLIGTAPVAADSIDADLVDTELADTEWSDPDLSDASLPAGVHAGGYAVRGHEFLIWDEDAREALDWATELLEAGAGSVDEPRWRSLATTSAAQPPILSDAFEADLKQWVAAAAGSAQPSSLGCILCLLPSLDRTAVIASWATSSDDAIRLALARSLSAPFDAVGVRAALDWLQHDRSAEIRRAARFAAASRGPLAG